MNTRKFSIKGPLYIDIQGVDSISYFFAITGQISFFADLAINQSVGGTPRYFSNYRAEFALLIWREGEGLDFRLI